MKDDRYEYRFASFIACLLACNVVRCQYLLSTEGLYYRSICRDGTFYNNNKGIEVVVLIL
jgi:hypothetical protein